MLTDKFFQVLQYEGVVAIVSWTKEEPHVANTWNSYLLVTDDGRILLPAAGMSNLEADISQNNQVLVILGARQVGGRNSYQRTGFRLGASAQLLSQGSEFDMMKEKFPFLRKVLELNPQSCQQLL